MHINSEDDYINDNSHVEFDDCGALLNLRGDRIIKSRNKDGFLVKIEYYNLTKSESPNERFLNKIINYSE